MVFRSNEAGTAAVDGPFADHSESHFCDFTHTHRKYLRIKNQSREESSGIFVKRILQANFKEFKCFGRS